MIPAFFSSARRILLECRESLASSWATLRKPWHSRIEYDTIYPSMNMKAHPIYEVDEMELDEAHPILGDGV